MEFISINVPFIDFQWPWIFLLLPLPALIRFFSPAQTSTAVRIPPRLATALDKVTEERSSTILWYSLLLWIAWLLLLCAISQPVVPTNVQAQPSSGRSITLAVDLSASMERRDFMIGEEQVDRLTVVKRIASDFLLARAGDRIGLVLFGSEAFVASPPTFDLNAVSGILASTGTGMAGRTTAIGNALGLAIQTLKNDPAENKAIVLLSDGTNNAGTAEPESAAELAQQLGIRIHTIGLGSAGNVESTDGYLHTSAAADLDESTLRAIADAANGQYFRAHTTQELRSIYQAIDKLEKTEANAPPVVVKQDIRNLFVLGLLMATMALALLGRKLGDRG